MNAWNLRKLAFFKLAQGDLYFLCVKFCQRPIFQLEGCKRLHRILAHHKGGAKFVLHNTKFPWSAPWPSSWDRSTWRSSRWRSSSSEHEIKVITGDSVAVSIFERPPSAVDMINALQVAPWIECVIQNKTNPFYRTQVYLGSDLWVRVSLTDVWL